MGDGRFRAVLMCYVVVDVDVNANFVAAERLFLWKFGSCVLFFYLQIVRNFLNW